MRTYTSTEKRSSSWRRLTKLIVVAGAWLALTPALAQAHYGFSTSFGGSELNNPLGIAVNESTGDIYVSNLNFTGTDAYDPAHNLLAPPSPFKPVNNLYSGTAVNPTNGDVYVVDGADQLLDTYDPTTGAMLSSFAINGTGNLYGAYTAVQIASDAAGNVYVPDPTDNVVDEFTPTGTLVQAFAGTGTQALNGPLGVAVDAAGNVWVADSGNNRIEEFNPTGTVLMQIASTGVQAIAVDGSGDVFASEQGASSGAQVVEYDPTGAQIDSFGLGMIGTSPYNADGGSPNAIAVDDTRQIVYVADGGNNTVWAFLQWGATTDTATNVSSTGATLNGTVGGDFGGVPVTSCEFQYGPTASYGQTAPCSVAAPYTSAQTVTASPALSPDTTYHYRLMAINANGVQSPGQDQTFTTSGPPTVDSQSSSNVAANTASLTAQINPFGSDATCNVQYVAQAAYTASGYASAKSVPCTPSDLGSGLGDQTATASLSGLSVATTYHYRFVATSTAAPNGADGPDQTFATFGLKSLAVQTLDQNGSPYTQAGGHPYELVTDFQFNTTTTQNGNLTYLSPAGNFHDLSTDLPAGLIGNPTATPQCTQAALENDVCEPDAQVGTVALTGSVSSCNATSCNTVTEPLYNMVPPNGVAARLGFNVVGNIYNFIDASVRTGGDYGITAGSQQVYADAGITGVKVTMWGVPADPSHNAQRWCPNGPNETPGPPCSTNAPQVPFLTNPTSCSGPITVTARSDSWQDVGDFTSATSTMPGFTGCDQLGFNPTITVQPDTTAADSPSGLSVDLSMPQDGLMNPTGLAEADLQDASVTLPQGVSVDPSAAAGLTSCTPSQIGMSNGNAPSCPDAAKIGTVEVDTPLLADPLTGGIYVAQQNQNPFNSLLAIYVTAYADGVWVKLAGHVVPNPVTGQLTTTFDNNPQLPFTDFKLDFFGGSHGILATPQQCGTYTTTSDLSSYAGGPDGTPGDSFGINSGCVNGFAPTFTAGTTNPQAGAYSPFVLSLTRADTDQSLGGLSVTLPDGMLAKLNGVAECSEADLAAAAAATGAQEQANPSCPASSQVGTVETGAGVGPDPYFLSGKVYLTGPYKGGPYGLAVVVPAVAGPYDLGTVVVRQALEINPTTAQVTDVSDPFPTILQGIPLRIRRIDVDLNRPGFTVNPTSCTPSSVSGTVTSIAGATAKMSSRFQVGGCAALAFSPKLKIALSGKGQTRSADHPTLTATLTDRSGQANIRSAKVTLPLSMALDPNNSQHVCSYATATAVHGGAVGCPTKTIVGKATADTPLLSKPLTGNVYLVQGLRCAKGSISAQGTCANGKTAIHTLPTLLVPLRGQIALDLRAKSSVNGAGALVTTFATIPDAPVSKFTLQITGGPKGLLVVTGRGLNICAKKQVASENLGAQSGKSMVADDTLTTPCKATKKSTKKARR